MTRPPSLNHKSHVGTSYAAKMLQMSVGTIQKMVRTGELPAFITSGGHRRIPYGAVVACMKNNGYADTTSTAEQTNSIDQICVLHSDKLSSPNLEKIAKDGSFQVITNPMNLLKPTSGLVHIFMDAHIEWINWTLMERSTNGLIHYVIYNSADLTEEEHKHLETFAVLLNTDISLELLHGYRLGFQSNAIGTSTPSYLQMINQ